MSGFVGAVGMLFALQVWAMTAWKDLTDINTYTYMY